MMLLYADENVPGMLVELLRKRSHDVTWALTEAAGATDMQVLDRAEAAGRVLLTFDKDFGDLVFRSRARARHGVVLVRRRIGPTEADAIALVERIEQVAWTVAGHFVVIDEGRTRVVPLPPSAIRE